MLSAPTTLILDADLRICFSSPERHPGAASECVFQTIAGMSISLAEAAEHVLETQETTRWGALRLAGARSEQEVSTDGPWYALEGVPMQGASGPGVCVNVRKAEPPVPPSAAMFATHIQSVPELLIHRFRPDTTETFVNDAYATLIGKPPASIRGTRWIERVSEAERNAYLEELQSLTPDAPFTVMRQSVTDGQGTERCIRWYVRGFFQEGRPDVYQAVGIDCTEQKDVEEKLFASQERMRRFLENVKPVVFAIDPDGTFLLSEGSDLKQLGLERGELVGQSVYDVYGENAFIIRDFERALRGEHVQSVVTLDNGLTFNTWYAPYNNAQGEVAGVLGMGIDVTTRVEAESALEKSESTYRNIINNASDAIYIQTPTGHFLDVNDAAASMYGYTRQELIGMTKVDVAAPGRNDMEQMREKLGEALNGVPQRFEFWGQRRDGTVFPKDVRVRRGTYFGLDVIIAFASDITERKQREQELIDAKESAEAASRLKTAMLTNMSHEIRTPLTGIIGFAEILMAEGNQTHQSFARRIRQNGKRLLRTLNDVLQLSDLEAGERQVSSAFADLTNIVRESVRPVQNSPAAQDLTVHFDLPLSVKGLWDRRAIDSILSHLLDNAVAFTKPGGTVRVRLRRDDGDVVLTVRDTGVGMDPAFIPSACNAFTQESRGTTRDHEGNGVGLAIVSRLVALLDGTMNIRSAKGEGTTVTVRLPHVQSTAAVDRRTAGSQEEISPR